jgi:preprotein translocase subunit SecD
LGIHVPPIRIAALVLIVGALALAPSDHEEGNGSGPSLQIRIAADLSGLPLGTDPALTLQGVAQVLERRADAFGAEEFKVTPEENGELSVKLRGVASEDARELLGKAGALDLRRPTLDEDGNLACQASDGRRFSVPIDEFRYVQVGSTGTPLPRCYRGPEDYGDLLWRSAAPAGGQNLTLAIRPNGATVDMTGGPLVAVHLTDQGATALSSITEQLVGLPLGIFVDGQLLAGPTVTQPITDGRLYIAGLSPTEAEILAIQLNAGVLPVPITVISIEEES